ncbi:hypothetical protein CHS0354_000213 [Potamilus streckersoni]|uniref:Uncharacterized protein n=1 Tax=Potamilus streckersoni TaxID=2493646 RepID=A0AAE0RQF5_9BIVA|nr:hypothetical protein CHS0354_000213 [Potamilus streckersoni]
MIYKIPLGLLLIVVGPYCVQTHDVFTDKKNIVEDDPSFSLRDTPMQISANDGTITAANVRCKTGTKCGYHQNTRYSWCETDYTWQYCCTSECKVDPEFEAWMTCFSGKVVVGCGNPGNRTISGKPCHPSHACGAHDGVSDRFHKYWCYTDDKTDWGYCCSPLSKCRDRNDGYGSWCYTGTVLIKVAKYS